jgi:hypothetical protein
MKMARQTMKARFTQRSFTDVLQLQVRNVFRRCQLNLIMDGKSENK